MSNTDVIENKISAIRRYLGILAQYQAKSVEELSSEVTLRGAVERYLYLVAQATIDLAEATIAFKGLRKPTTMAESFSILVEAGLMDEQLGASLVKMVGFRNILAHDYERVDPRILLEVLRSRLGEVERFIQQVAPAQ